MTDNTTIHPASQHLAHLLDLFLFKGAPVNTDADRPVTVLVNHGYAVGYAPDRRQPLWAAYRVAGGSGVARFERPMLYYADERLEDSVRLDNTTFGKHDGVQYNVGHMVPNSAINSQFGRLAQMETFFMSNMSPQWGSLNQGVWRDLEARIHAVEEDPEREHLWTIAGSVFGDDPLVITRKDGIDVPVPEAYYCITIDPFRYPYDRSGNQDIACFVIPQDAPRRTPLETFMTTLEEIETRTRLQFMPGWASEVAQAESRETLEAMRAMRDIPQVRTRSGVRSAGAVAAATDGPPARHRLLRQL